MKRTTLALVAAAATHLAAAPSLPADPAGKPVLPREVSPEDYRPIWIRSPFSAVAASPDGGDSGTWTLAGFVRNGDQTVVIISNKQTQERMTVTDKPNEKGFSVESVDSRPSLLQSSARIKTPSETVVVKFDAAALTAASVQPTPIPLPPPGTPPFVPVPVPVPAPGAVATPLQRSPGAGSATRIIVPPSAIPNPPLPPPSR